MVNSSVCCFRVDMSLSVRLDMLSRRIRYKNLQFANDPWFRPNMATIANNLCLQFDSIDKILHNEKRFLFTLSKKSLPL